MSEKPMEKTMVNLSEMSRRDVIKTLGPAAAAVGLAGCMGGDSGGDGGSDGGGDGGDGGTTSTTTQSSSQPQVGGTLNAGMKVGIETMDGRSVTGLQSFQVFYNIYSKLMRWRRDGDELVLVGDLATEWEWEDDTTLVISLNEDAVFHNGEPVTANDVAYTFDTLYDQPQYTASLLFAQDVTVSARDEHTVEFDTGEQPFASLESTLGFIVGIINEKADKEGDMSSNPVGSGPFVFEEWVDGDHVYMNKFEDYWKEDEDGTQLPYLDRIEFTIYPDVNTKLTTLEQDQLDWIDLVPRREVERIRNHDTLVTEDSGQGAFMGIIQFNTTAPPFSDPNVRKAVLHAMDWDTVLEVAFHGVASRADNFPIPPQSGWDPDVEDPYQGQDLERAEELLAEAEVDHTAEFTNFVTRGDNIRITMQELLQEMLNQNLGMNFNIQIADGSVVFEEQSNNNFGFTVSGFNGMFDPDQMFSVNLVEGAFFNYGGYVNEEIQQLVPQARQTTDRAQREELYGQIMEQYIADAGKYYPYWDHAVQAMQPRVKNYKPLLDQEWWFEQVWLDQSM
ncbi:peptide/nickel transport system substrate-binding protein [Halogranum gelatinilyticum]|uniref:Peptide/nickel transport system substrate-binding protein n=1 Tax=Halogranum gelatinilyticum TaxID=660521 RepID=A0A1G9Z022_9EURY|nr:ABC transporter substrate-binding protein [Halogranum gelatinilyticum]SDN14728.1 peptide/nickel transport system substrate-binding protein [Halogranum gelatinilyticum]